MDRGRWDYNGKYYKVPFPYEEGIRRWPVADWTRQYGAPGEIDDEGVIRKICVVPKPYQDPHPPLFQPFSVSETTIRYTAQAGIVPWILVANPPDFQRLCNTYREVAGEAGRKLGLGESGAFRAVHSKDQAGACCPPARHHTGFQNYLADWVLEGFVLPRAAKSARSVPPLPPRWTLERCAVEYGRAERDQ